MNSNRWVMLGWISLAELLALSLWYSASVVIVELKQIWQLSLMIEAWLASSVTIGFIIGAVISSYFYIADRYNPRKVFVISALMGALFNILLIFSEQAIFAILIRLLTGITLAGVYPTAVKQLSQWFPKQRGLAIGILIAALSVGTAIPHFIALVFISVHWKFVIFVSSGLALIAAVIMNWLVVDVPTKQKKTIFSFRLIKKIVKNKPVMLANYGYFGHMWELYAMWTWLPSFLIISFRQTHPEISTLHTSLASFLSIGIAGAIGSIIGGYLADKIGRSKLTILSLLGSASCSILIGFTFGQAIWITFTIAFIWGIFVIADSAQFSAAVSDFSDESYLGTALTFQMCVGFIITIITIQLIPILQKIVGWEFVFMMLSLGPIFGIFSMLKFNKYEVKKRNDTTTEH